MTPQPHWGLGLKSAPAGVHQAVQRGIISRNGPRRWLSEQSEVIDPPCYFRPLSHLSRDGGMIEIRSGKKNPMNMKRAFCDFDLASRPKICLAQGLEDTKRDNALLRPLLKDVRSNIHLC